MKTYRLFFFLFFIYCAASVLAQSTAAEKDSSSFFEGYTGTFVLYDVNKDHYLIYNKAQAEKRLSPCSTFKILNSLIGLETGVIKDQNHPMK